MTRVAESMPPGAPVTDSFKLLLVFLCASVGALVVGLAPVAASLLDGQYTPIGPDGFYHARRILDAVADPSSFFQFDQNTDAPDGGLVLWPWAYDYALSVIVRVALALGLSSDPMAMLVHIPPIAFVLTMGVALALCRGLGLSVTGTFAALLCTAFFPLNQALYSVGNIDHHFAEHLLVLGSIASAVLWLQKPESRAHAAITGIVLGLAPGVHTALFVLQIPLLAALALMWLRGQPRPGTTLTFAAALVLATLAIALPSLPLQRGHFEYYTLSWFQVYVATCTAVLSVLLARTQLNRAGMLRIGIAALLMLAPILGQMALARDFFTVSVEGMGEISEVQSPLELWRRSGSLGYVVSLYTYLVFLAPATPVLCAWKIWREPNPVRAVFWIASLAGLVLLTIQMRLQYFGSFALYLPWLLLLDDWVRKGTIKPAYVWAPALAALTIAYLPGLRHHIFESQAAAGDPNYEVTRALYAPFAQVCRAQPGVVLAEPNDGHYIRFHTNCPVIADNFLVTPRQAERTRKERELLELSAKELITRAPNVRYVYVRRKSLFYSEADGSMRFAPDGLDGFREPALVEELLGAEANALPDHYRLIVDLKAAGGTRPIARLFALDRPDGT
jgi:hypothetical protein